MPAAAPSFSLPPEWSPQEAVWLSWPVDNPEHWGNAAKRTAIRAKFAEIAAAISRFETVRINAEAAEHPSILAACREAGADSGRIELFDHPHNDVWCRDHGPIFVRDSKTGALVVTDWEFNAWGGKFPPWNLDNAIPRRIAEALGLPRVEPAMVLEGGAIEINGAGQLLTTEAVLLNPNRNPNLSRPEIEDRLRRFLGATEILWLARGIEGDDTDGHIDDLARFASDTTILAATAPDPDSPNHPILAENLARLAEFRTPTGRPFGIVEIPLPEACEVPGWRLPVLPASYLNFLVLNAALLLPTFRQPKNDDRARSILADLFPDRQIIPIDCLDLVQEAGALHCISMQQPA